MSISNAQACYFAHELTRLGAVGELERLSTTIFDSKVDLNPHQVEAALFAISNPLQKGVILADEVGLGKTIEAGLVLCQRWAERRRRLIVVCPAHIRKQWQTELTTKFNLPSSVIDRRVWNDLRKKGQANPFDTERVWVVSYGFASRMKDDLRAIPFDLVVLDEAHKLRNAYQISSKGGQAVRWAFELRNKLLLTATPLQNSLLELYGLAWVIDDHIFGDRSSFQSRYCNAGGDLVGLRERLSQFCKRTLRKDCVYLNYKKRQAMTHPFPQTAEEKSLHRDVMDFMLRDNSFSFPQQQRQLIEMILFKTLASSPQALASTLTTMRQRLIAIRDQLPKSEVDNFLSVLANDEDFDIESFVDDLDLEEPNEQPSPLVVGRLLAEELKQLDDLIVRASRLHSDSKSKALLQALDAAFARLAELGAQRKAIIFTESRRTQDFLQSFLESNGYAGKVVTFNGSNTHPTAKDAYDRFVSQHAGTDKVTGSRSVDVRTALIDEFAQRADILLATEAAAEGINLQFCSLVVNYDLPWNPQRIEQRIGRCHRYGQKHDVIVVNFLSQDNVADKRVHDLLQQKFRLFDGLFGASDEVLGAIEDGVDFEKRIIAILKSCRTNQEIEAAFDALQIELESTINQRMTLAQQQLFDHFDTEVHERLKVRSGNAKVAIDCVGERFWRLAKWGLTQHATFNDTRLELDLHAPLAPEIAPGRYRLISAAKAPDDYADTEAHLLRLSSPLGEWLVARAKAVSPAGAAAVPIVRFNVSLSPRKVSMLNSLIGSRGWLRIDKVSLTTDVQEEYLVLSGITDANASIDQETLQRLLDMDGTEAGLLPFPETLNASLTANAQQAINARLTEASESSNQRFQRAQAEVDRWADDKIAAADLEMDRLRRELRDARRLAAIAKTIPEQLERQAKVAEVDRKRARFRQEIFQIEEDVEAKREDLIQKLRQQVQRHSQSDLLLIARWEVA